MNVLTPDSVQVGALVILASWLWPVAKWFSSVLTTLRPQVWQAYTSFPSSVQVGAITSTTLSLWLFVAGIVLLTQFI